MKPNPMTLTIDGPSGATPAQTLEHMQWLNSPLTRKLLTLLRGQRAADHRIVECAVFDPTITTDQVRAHAARAWMCNKIIELTETLPNVDVPVQE